MSNTSNTFYQSKYSGEQIDELLGYTDNMVKVEIPEIKEFQGLLNNNKLELKVVDTLPSVGEGEFVYLKQEESEGLLYHRLYIWNTLTNGWCEIVTSDIANLLSDKFRNLITKESNARKEADSEIESDLLSKLDFKEGKENDASDNINLYMDDTPTLYKIISGGYSAFTPYYLIVMKCSYAMIPGVSVKTHVQYKIASHGIYRRYYMDGIRVSSYWTDWEELSPGTDTTPTEGSKKFITSGGVYEICKLLDDTKPGEKIADAGEIFNDYENNVASGQYSHAEGSSTTASGDYSHAGGSKTKAISNCSVAMGEENISGGKGYYIRNIDYSNKKIYLSNEWCSSGYNDATDNTDNNFDTPAYSVGDIFSIAGNIPSDSSQGYSEQHYHFCASINSISHNVIVYNEELPFTSLIENKDEDHEFPIFLVPSKPEIGSIEIGYNCFSEGEGNISGGRASHAEGRGNIAIGRYSHAEGRNTKASYAAHAEGLSTQAIGMYSHTEGKKTEALGKHTHAEGYDTTASGDSSHAEGVHTTATEYASHAEGYLTTASNSCSHAEGDHTNASGDSSHAEGEGTNASGVVSHAEGKSTTASGDFSHAEGLSTQAIGMYSHTEGKKTEALGKHTHAEGYDTTASGDSSHAEGTSTTASGYVSHAEGSNTVAGQKGFLIDKANSSETNKMYKLSSVDGLRVNDQVSICSGSSINSLTKRYLKFGQIKEINTENKTIIVETYITFEEAVGYLYIAGKNVGDTLICGNSSHAEGYNTTASDNYSHSEGESTKATGIRAHAEGYSTEASGEESHAEGYHTTASGALSHAEGYSSEASGYGSHAEGRDTKAGSSFQHVQGKFNIVDSNNVYADIVGNGTSNEARSNAYTLDWDGNAWFAGNITIGSDNDVLITEKKADSLYGATVSINVDPQTYICTFTLKNSNDEIISTSSIDLPLESMVVSGEYNAETKKVVLTLKSGDTVEFSIADLVSGLVSQSDVIDSLDSAETTKPLSAAQGKVLNDSKADKSAITNSTETTVSTELSDNTELIYGEVSSISVTFPAVGLDYTSSIIFTTPATLPENYSTFPSDVYFKGDECDGGIFIPNAATRYTMLFYYDGTKIIGLVSGIEVTA